jgi:hypothetical protein
MPSVSHISLFGLLNTNMWSCDQMFINLDAMQLHFSSNHHHPLCLFPHPRIHRWLWTHNLTLCRGDTSIRKWGSHWVLGDCCTLVPRCASQRTCAHLGACTMWVHVGLYTDSSKCRIVTTCLHIGRCHLWVHEGLHAKPLCRVVRYSGCVCTWAKHAVSARVVQIFSCVLSSFPPVLYTPPRVLVHSARTVRSPHGLCEVRADSEVSVWTPHKNCMEQGLNQGLNPETNSH